MPLAVVERLAMQGAVTHGQMVMVHLETAHHTHYQVVCHVSQSSPPSYSLLLERRSLPHILRPSFDQSLLVVAEPLDIGGFLSLYNGGGVQTLPGTIVGFEISI